MFSIFISALNQMLAFMFRAVIFKFGAFTILFALVSSLIGGLISLLPNPSSLAVFGSVPSTVWFFANMFSISQGMTLLIGAYVTRFIIRRIPIIG